MRDIPVMVVPAPPPDDAHVAHPADLLAYVADMAGQLAALCLAAGRPEAARSLLRVQIDLGRDQPSAAPGDAA